MKKNILLIIAAAILTVAAGLWFGYSVFYEKTPSRTVKVGIIYQGANFKQVVDGFLADFKENLPKNTQAEYIIKDVVGTEQKDFDAAAEEIVGQKAEVILAVGIEAVKAAQKSAAENKIPIILELGINPVSGGFVENFQKPGGNITGVTWQVDELTGKRLEMLKLLAPKIKHITIFRRKDTKAMEKPLQYLKPVADNLGIAFTVKEFSTLEELEKAIAGSSARETDAFFYGSDPLVSRNLDLVIKRAFEEKLPTMFHDELWARSGGLAAYGGNFFEAGRQGSRMAAKILFENQLPADIPVETVLKIDFAVNLETAKKIGLSIPEEVLSLANVVIRE